MEAIDENNFLPNSNARSTNKRGLGARQLLETEITSAQKVSASAADTARNLGVSYNTYKKYAKMYGLFDDNKNPTGKGIKKTKAIRNRKYHIDDLISGKHTHYPLIKFKNKLFDGGIVPRVCGSCGFSEARITDNKVPLLLDFIDGDLNNRKLENIRPLCYNCYFLTVGSRNVKKWYEMGDMTEEKAIQAAKEKYSADLYN